MPFELKNELGNRYGRLVVIERQRTLPMKSRQSARWICICDCGTETAVYGHNLRLGMVKSCGCLLAEHWARSVPPRSVYQMSRKPGFGIGPSAHSKEARR